MKTNHAMRILAGGAVLLAALAGCSDMLLGIADSSLPTVQTGPLSDNPTLDTGFGSSGYVTFGTGEGVSALKVAPSGSIYALVRRADANNQITYVVRKYDARGTAVTAYGENGEAVVNTAVAYSSASTGSGDLWSLFFEIDSDESTYVGMETDMGDFVIKFTPAGVPDTSFFNDGYATVKTGELPGSFNQGNISNYVTVGNDVIYFAPQFAVATDYKRRVAAMDAGAQYLSGFGGAAAGLNVYDLFSSAYPAGVNGINNPPFMALDPQGNLVGAGTLQNTTDGGNFPHVFKLSAQGQAVTSFGNGGSYTLQSNLSTQLAITEIPPVFADDGSLYVNVRMSGANPQRQFILRLTTAGAPDPNFGTDGLAELTVEEYYNLPLFADSVGVYVMIQGSGNNSPSFLPSSRLVRYKLDGTIDSAFGGDGAITGAELGSSFVGAGPRAVVKHGNGLVIAGSFGTDDYRIVRLR